MTPEKNSQKNIKIIVVAIIFIVLLIAIFGLVQLLQRSGKTAVGIQKMPRDTKIFINNKLTNGSTLYLEPGNYTLRGEKLGFESVSKTFKVSDENSTPLKEFVILTPKSSEALLLVQENTKDYQKIEKAAEAYYSQQGQNNTDLYPIIKDLPYRGTLYNIDYYLDGGDFRLQIKSSDALGRQVAIEKIKLMGYEPTDYTIEFLDLANPFIKANQ